MPTFDESRQQLQQARSQRDDTQRALFLAKESLRQQEAEILRVKRSVLPGDSKSQLRLQQLQTRKADLEQAVSKLEKTLTGRLSVEAQAAGQFAAFTDPRKQLGQWTDSYPILLFPVRIETRFKRVSAAASQAVNQLWVRIYPDDAMLDTFDPALAESEAANARLYWINWWKAGGIESQQRGAWKTLTGSHGAGRAAWIIRQYEPVNLASVPVKAQAQDLVLVIATAQALAGAELAAAAAYWEAIWRAGSNAGAVLAAAQQLSAALGAQRADEIVADYQPVNLADMPQAPLTRANTPVQVAQLILPDESTLETRRSAWSQAPKAHLLPDRFLVLGYRNGVEEVNVLGNPIPSPLVAGPDPAAAADEQLRPEGKGLFIPEPMRWMTDFDEAIAKGMGLRIDLTPQQAQEGFDRLIVLGLRFSADQTQGQQLLETHWQHQFHSRSGFSLVAQGTPTNNTESEDSGYSWREDSDESFDRLVLNRTPLTLSDNWQEKPDGQWLAELLGINPAILEGLRYAAGRDQAEARAMNTALWPATMGYLMDTLMEPVLSDDHMELTRWFYTRYVSGRGAMPAIRVGAQPYGILPAVAYSRLNWARRMVLPAGEDVPAGARELLPGLRNILQLMYADWSKMRESVAYVGKPGDPHQLLLDIVGLHPASVEFHQRYAESQADLFNRFNLMGLGGTFIAALLAAGYLKSGDDLLKKLGYSGEVRPEVLEKFFLSRQHLLKGPVVDDAPLSETQPIRAYTPDGRNYLRWLIDAAGTSLETLRRKQGFTDNKSPRTLLFLMLHHALELGYFDSALRLLHHSEVIDTKTLATLRKEPAFMHIQEQAPALESRWQLLYRTEPNITQSNTQLLTDYLSQNLSGLFATRYLQEQLNALEKLADIPTARLERIFAEHLDTVSYRLDAWMQGMARLQLSAMRYRPEGQGGVAVRQGIYLGAYGWLEQVRPENKPLRQVALSGDLADAFLEDGAPPIVQDAANGGFIHAPSLNQAVTAAILRNGYLANASPSEPGLLGVNLSSERVRNALGVLEGMRNGQSLSALLGYRFERGLHDRHHLAEVDKFIYPLRKAFPLAANRLRATKLQDNTPIKAIEARNVMDGLALVKHIQQTNAAAYPFGKPLPAAAPAEAAAINAEVERLLDLHDAISDLAIAESVHQTAAGNYDRAAASLDAFSRGNFPPEPEVVQTPRSGKVLTHRVAIHLESGVSPEISPDSIGMTPRAMAEPAINRFLFGLLPLAAQSVCRVEVTDPANGVLTPLNISRQDLGLQPIDLLYLLDTADGQGMKLLDDLLLRQATAALAPRPDAEIAIRYTVRIPGLVTFFELAPMVRSLRSLLLSSRPLRPGDVALSLEASAAQEQHLSVDLQRVTLARNQLLSLEASLAAFLAGISPLTADAHANRAALIAQIDILIQSYSELAAEAGRFGITQPGFGFTYAWKRQWVLRLLEQIEARISQWNERLTRFDALISEYTLLPGTASDEERFTMLYQAEAFVSTLTTLPKPAAPADLLVALAARRAAFSAKLAQLSAVKTGAFSGLPALLNQVHAMLPLDAFDQEPFVLTSAEDTILRFAEDLTAQGEALAAEIARRLAASQAQLDAYTASADPAAQADLLVQAGKGLFGDDFRMVPEFQSAPEAMAEWFNAWNARSGLLDHQINTLQQPYPVEDWLHGIARVREPMRHWEQAVWMAEALRGAELPLQPVQLPYKEADSWLALEYPESAEPDADRLLYTAYYPAPLNPALRQCGLLIDDWTEVLPVKEETTGLAFHYDRPNQEPPQTMLLVLPSQIGGSWTWEDLLGALHETLDLARVRAVEPQQVDQTAYARLLPATLASATLNRLTISANFLQNNVIQPPND